MFFAGVKTLDELKAAYRKLAQKYHPDHGGDTETMQKINNEYSDLFEKLKQQHNAAADEEHQSTECPEEFITIISELLKLDGLDVELCGSWVWIGGNTKEHKETLKVIGCKWSPKKKLWYWHHPEDGYIGRHKNRDMSYIRMKYGSKRFDSVGSAGMGHRIGIGAAV